MPRFSATKLLCCITALLVAPACDEWHSPDENVLTIIAYTAVLDSAAVYATIEMPGFNRTVPFGTLQGTANISVIAKSGTIRVTFARVKGAADTIGRVEKSFEIVKGYTYNATVIRERAGQPHFCVSCSESLTFPMTGSERGSTDRMRLSYTYGPPLCKGCVAMGKDAGLVQVLSLLASPSE